MSRPVRVLVADDERNLRELLVRLAREYRPKALYITENGAAYPDQLIRGQVQDPQRTHYLERHFTAAWQALQAGAPLQGYFVWSLLDNFEWAEGYEPKFGLFSVDLESPEKTRTETPAVATFQDIARNLGLTPKP